MLSAPRSVGLTRYAEVSLAFCIALIALCYGLNRVPLMWPDEGRNAEVGREMKVSGQWLVPTYNGTAYLDKPAFYFKAIAFSLALFGDTQFAARIPSAASAFALLLSCYFFCRRVCNARCAALAVTVIATTPLFLAYARIVIFDMMLTLFVCCAIFAGYLAEEFEGRRRRNWYLLASVAAGFATLVKGPVGVIVPVLVLLIFNWLDGRKGAARRVFAPSNFAVFFTVVLPWFIGLSVVHPDFPRYGIVEESFHRFTTGSFQRSKPFYYYPLIVAGTFLPWSLLFPGCIIAVWKKRSQWARIDRLCVVWTMVVLIFFSFSNSKMPGYILSLSVSLGILIARLFDRLLERSQTSLKVIPLRAVTALALVGAAGVMLAVALGTNAIDLRRFRVRQDDLEQIRHFWIPLAIVFLSMGVLSALAVARRSSRTSFAALAGFPVAAVLLNMGILEFAAARRSASSMAQQLSALAANAKVVCLECLPHGLPFYLGKTVTVLTKDGAELTSNYVLFNLKSGSIWPDTLIPLVQQERWLAQQTEPLVLIGRSGSRAALEKIATEHKTAVVPLTGEYSAVLLPERAPI